MLSKTTISAIQALIYLASQDMNKPVSPRHIALELDLSPTYLAKILNLLVKAAILRAYRGVHGGVTLIHQDGGVTLREIVEACQGHLVADFCCDTNSNETVCAFHEAMAEVHHATAAILSKWTLADLASRPGKAKGIASALECRMSKLCPMSDTP